MNRPTLRQLEYLIALYNEQSFSAAAETCHVTQSTLSAGIKELETILDQQLVTRGRKSITLTAFGMETMEQARMILEETDKITARAQQIKAPLSGPLRLGIIPTIAPYALPNILPYLQGEFPDLELQLYEDLSARLLELLHKKQIDAALIALPYDTENMECHDLFKEDFYLASPKDKDIPDNIAINDIKPEELLLLEDGHCLRDHALSACKLQLPSQRKTFSATSLATLIQMVGHGYGITLLPEMVVKYAPMPDTITLTPFKTPAPTRQIGIIWNKNHAKKRDLLELLGALRDFLD
ncbi:MAG: hydrogen peroxide-inducible genes activator [Alphaproteobacteria bacterium]